MLSLLTDVSIWWMNYSIGPISGRHVVDCLSTSLSLSLYLFLSLTIYNKNENRNANSLAKEMLLKKSLHRFQFTLQYQTNRFSPFKSAI